MLLAVSGAVQCNMAVDVAKVSETLPILSLKNGLESPSEASSDKRVAYRAYRTEDGAISNA